MTTVQHHESTNGHATMLNATPKRRNSSPPMSEHRDALDGDPLVRIEQDKEMLRAELAQIDARAQKIRTALGMAGGITDTLVEPVRTATRARPSVRKPARTVKPRAPRADGLPSRVLAAIEAQPGESAGALATLLGVKATAVSNALNALKRAGKVVGEGNRRDMRWTLVATESE